VRHRISGRGLPQKRFFRRHKYDLQHRPPNEHWPSAVLQLLRAILPSSRQGFHSTGFAVASVSAARRPASKSRPSRPLEAKEGTARLGSTRNGAPSGVSRTERKIAALGPRLFARGAGRPRPRAASRPPPAQKAASISCSMLHMVVPSHPAAHRRGGDPQRLVTGAPGFVVRRKCSAKAQRGPVVCAASCLNAYRQAGHAAEFPSAMVRFWRSDERG